MQQVVVIMVAAVQSGFSCKCVGTKASDAINGWHQCGQQWATMWVTMQTLQYHVLPPAAIERWYAATTPSYVHKPTVGRVCPAWSPVPCWVVTFHVSIPHLHVQQHIFTSG